MSSDEAAIVFGRDRTKRSWLRAGWRGLAGKCPECGRGALFAGYTRTHGACAVCGLNFAGHRADDAPPYATIMIVGHLTIPLALAAKQLFDPPLALQFAISAPLILGMTLWLLPIVKGGLIGLQWANRMHGFAEPRDEAENWT
ncbi:DUF983 domain-containing protein [Amphiplicatus metriothermophilus]|uniref:Uncharacterized conserved protein, DUF983 family n=1 Tax=Amphiplicatus metriothermophilus TaxID=1519374 RepID=A0A239PPW3_9PROT|nr:DUF983 domain-containing protein [Amphiplicatus metriothermophilus]MBB5518875.1 uncharacterized protein (DUF983 family) [Amphiplicatus metriothermophilus]SNT71972.1 Uncharacterized conserved protein, DUF983 family [Amphiplicatus metriothermophilus]